MTKAILVFTVLIFLCLTACKEAVKTENANTETINETNPLIGAWVEPNPIDTTQVQGLAIHADGTAESINMATLVYKKWWKDAEKLVLVAESI